MPGLTDIATPALLLDRDVLAGNLARMRRAVAAHAVTLRPHVKTAKSIDVLRMVDPSLAGPWTVSSLAEAEALADAGATDIRYAVGITPSKLDRVHALRARGVDLSIILDSLDAARAVSASATARGDAVPVLIEIDSDGVRAGVKPDDGSTLRAIAEAVRHGAVLAGVLTHCGGSYSATSPDELRGYAEQERAAAVAAAERLRAMGHAMPVVSVGSTPTALFAADLTGVTEVRAGVYMFMDLVMAGLGVCQLHDIAISVVATVIGRRSDTGEAIVDAGWTALSRDRGTASQPVDHGYGLVCDLAGQPLGGAVVAATSQEHGMLRVPPGQAGALPELRVGDRVRILPNHACATAAEHDAYAVVEGDQVVAQWLRFRGW